jgi:hypothetical protein
MLAFEESSQGSFNARRWGWWRLTASRSLGGRGGTAITCQPCSTSDFIRYNEFVAAVTWLATSGLRSFRPFNFKDKNASE